MLVAYDNAGNTAVKDDAEIYYIYTVIPEVPSLIIMPLSILAMVIAVFIGKKSVLSNFIHHELIAYEFGHHVSAK